MYNNHGVQRYRETDINSMSKEKMIVLLYEKMQSDLVSAQKAIRSGDRVEMTKKINHSQRIVSELRGALDHSIGGEVSQNLESLYDFMFHEHLNVLVDQNEKHILNCLKVLDPLLEAWRKIPSGTADKALNPSGPETATEPVPQGEAIQNSPPEKTTLLSVSA
jgi:flagellar secretion chaperone FliS